MVRGMGRRYHDRHSESLGGEDHAKCLDLATADSTRLTGKGRAAQVEERPIGLIVPGCDVAWVNDLA